MTHEELEGYRKQLAEIQSRAVSKGHNVQKELQEMALKVGACTQTVFLSVGNSGMRNVREAEICELSYNIHQALQTASMINMCETASKGYGIAVDATRNARLVSVIALVSAIAAWFAPLCK